MRDAMEDVCTIISKWYDCLLEKYNESLDEKRQSDGIGKLFKDNSEYKTKRVREKAKELGLSAEELLVIGRYKKDRNVIVHKDEWNEFTSYTKDIALKRLEIASKEMSSECKIAVEKCINQLY